MKLKKLEDKADDWLRPTEAAERLRAELGVTVSAKTITNLAGSGFVSVQHTWQPGCWRLVNYPELKATIQEFGGMGGGRPWSIKSQERQIPVPSQDLTVSNVDMSD
jgi:hypothetical protein